MKRLRSGGLFSGYLLHCLHSGHVSRGHRPSLTKKWALFLGGWGYKKLGRCSVSRGASWPRREPKGIEGKIGNIKMEMEGKRGLNREEELLI